MAGKHTVRSQRRSQRHSQVISPQPPVSWQDGSFAFPSPKARHRSAVRRARLVVFVALMTAIPVGVFANPLAAGSDAHTPLPVAASGSTQAPLPGDEPAPASLLPPVATAVSPETGPVRTLSTKEPIGVHHFIDAADMADVTNLTDVSSMSVTVPAAVGEQVSVSPTKQRMSLPTSPRMASKELSDDLSAPKASSFDWKVERWRGLVASYFPPEMVDDALSVMSCESSGVATAKNPDSSATGLFQFIDATWLWIGPLAHVSGVPRTNPDANVRAAAWLVRHTIEINDQRGPWAHWSCRP